MWFVSPFSQLTIIKLAMIKTFDKNKQTLIVRFLPDCKTLITHSPRPNNLTTRWRQRALWRHNSCITVTSRKKKLITNKSWFLFQYSRALSELLLFKVCSFKKNYVSSSGWSFSWLIFCSLLRHHQRTMTFLFCLMNSSRFDF